MALSVGIKMLVIEFVWPWVRENIWPIIQEHVIGLVKIGLRSLSESIFHEAKHGADAGSAEAEVKAVAAERSAKLADTEAERDKQESIAKIWREVAEKYRADNEELSRKIEKITTRKQHDLCTDIRSSSPSIEQSNEVLVLTLNGKSTSLPALPSPDEKS